MILVLTYDIAFKVICDFEGQKGRFALCTCRCSFDMLSFGVILGSFSYYGANAAIDEGRLCGEGRCHPLYLGFISAQIQKSNFH